MTTPDVPVTPAVPVFITPDAPQSMRPDVHYFPAEDLLDDALIVTATTKAGVVAGDQPVVRVPFVDIEGVDFFPEGAEIDTVPIDSREAVIATGALAVITLVSVDQHAQPGVTNLLSNELRRSMVEKADHALLSQPS